MSSLDNITDKIKSRANSKVEELNRRFKKEAGEILADKRSEALIAGKKLVEKTLASEEQRKQRTVSSALLVKRDAILMEKQKMIDKCFEMAKKKFSEIGDEEYAAFLEKNLGDFAEDSESVLLVPKSRQKIAKKYSGNLKVKVDNTITGGFKVEKNGVIYNFCFDDLIDYNRDKIETQVLEILVKGGE